MAKLWEMGCFRCEIQQGLPPRLCLYHQEALLRAVSCEGEASVQRESEELRRFVEDPLMASVMAVRHR